MVSLKLRVQNIFKTRWSYCVNYRDCIWRNAAICDFDNLTYDELWKQRLFIDNCKTFYCEEKQRNGRVLGRRYWLRKVCQEQSNRMSLSRE